MLLIISRKRNKRPIAQVSVVSQPKVNTLEEELPKRIVIGANPDQPVVTIEALSSTRDYEIATPLDTQNSISTSIGRLSQLCQSLPSLLVVGEAGGKRLMEVVINGDLVRAADGNGLRAFMMTSNRITQNARLYEASNLQNMVNAVAIWQIASVVVAQKHLADISIKLDEIKGGIQAISQFLDNQRKSRIRATCAYLEEVYQAIQGGDFPDAARNQLEVCERDLLEIQEHLMTEYRQKADMRVKHVEMFGTESLTTDIANKLHELELLADDIGLCLKTRIAAWHVLSLFPGDSQLKSARRINIQESVVSIQSLGPYCEEKIKGEISEVYSFWNRESTLVERRNSLTSKCDSTVQALTQKAQQCHNAMKQIDQLMLANDRPTRILLHFENGALAGVRQVLA
ncbi:MAG: hypothetical protein HONDAALG_02890 [Gammaproteobacteria bacterium]|nr:hypothetical protein [Gammaproteobacteria bacterium]